CEHLRDRFLLSLLAETGMRVGQALGLRHADFVSRTREVHIVPRADNANGARAKVRSAAVIPVSTPLVRLYSEYMHVEYGGVDSDYVFVNLFGGDVGRALTYSAVHQLIGRIAARTGIGFTAHTLRHSHATDMVRQGVPVEVVARLLTHRSPATPGPGLCPPRRRRHRGGAGPGRGVAEEGGGPVTSPVPAAQGRSRLRVVAGEAAALDGEWAADRWKAPRLGIPARRGRGQARFDQINQPWLRAAGKPRSAVRAAPGGAGS